MARKLSHKKNIYSCFSEINKHKNSETVQFRGLFLSRARKKLSYGKLINFYNNPPVLQGHLQL